MNSLNEYLALTQYTPSVTLYAQRLAHTCIDFKETIHYPGSPLRQSQFPIIILFFFILILSFPGGEEALAYENMHADTGVKKCQSSCHDPERIIQAKQDKFNRPQCISCHTGVPKRAQSSPFEAPAFKRISVKADSNKPAQEKEKAPAPESADKNPASKKMALVPAGEFIMGSNERWDDEGPEHIARTDAFYIDLYEVTNSDYKIFAEATKREKPYHWPKGEIPKGKEKHPVVYVNWFDAQDYCKWSGKRLPTEIEWEKAARGEDGLIYPWGNEWHLDRSNHPYNYSTGTQPVGTYPNGRSPYGLYDMSGNVWEWVDSFYMPHPGNTVIRSEYGKDKRLLKGGSWFDCLSYGCGLSAPTFNRSFFTPEVRNNSFGFRCAKSH